jgi:hypothetical protein
MDNLVVLHTGHALDLLGLLRLLKLIRLLGDQLLQVLYLMLQLCGLSLTRIKLSVSLVQLGLEVVNIALGGSQLVLSVLQSGAGIIKKVDLEVTATVGPRQLIVQLLDARLKAGILLKKLSVALLNILDGAVLGLHLTSVHLQAEALVGTSCRDLLKQGAHVLGIVCRERPTYVVGWKLGVANGSHALTPHRVALVPNGEQGNGGAAKDRQVALTELHEGMVGSPLQSVIEIVAPSRGKPSHHGRVRGVSRCVHMDLASPKPKLMVWATMVRESPCVAKAVQHVSKQGGKTRAAQPIATEPSVGSEGGIEVVVHLSKTRKK